MELLTAKEAEIIQYGGARVLSTLDSAKEPNLAYEEAEDSDVEESMGEEEKVELEVFSDLGDNIYQEACRIVDEIKACLAEDLSEEVLEDLEDSILQLDKDGKCCLKLSEAWDRKYEEEYDGDEESECLLIDVKEYKDHWVKEMVSKWDTFQLKVATMKKNPMLSASPSLCPPLTSAPLAPLLLSSRKSQAVEAVDPDVKDDLEEVLPLSCEESQQALAMLKKQKAVRESLEPLTAEKEMYFLAKGAEVQKP